MSTTQLVATPARVSLVQKFAHRFSIDPGQLLPILKATAFQVKGAEVTNEQMAALLVVADQYGLNPFTKEIFAFPDKQNGIVPVVGVDGWSRIINDHPQADGIEFRYAEEILSLPDAQPCPAWCEVVIYRKDRGHPVIVREYLEECYRPPHQRTDGSKVKGPWQTHTRRFLRHKTLIQGARIAFGFGGIYDEDEATRIVEAQVVRVEEEAPLRGTAALAAARERAKAAETAPEAQGEARSEPAPDARPPAEEPARAAETGQAPVAEADVALAGAVADAIAVLDVCSNRSEVTRFAEDKALPEAVRTHPEFVRAVERRLAALAKPAKK